MRRAARRLAAFVVALQASMSALGAVTVCLPGPHLHHGVAAPDCVMHHAAGSHSHGAAASTAQRPVHAGHQGHSQHAQSRIPADARMDCACGEELRALHPFDVGTVVTAPSSSPILTATLTNTSADPRPLAFTIQPFSPPPRG